MVSFAAADLAAQAGVDPWTLLETLHQGDPAEIEGLAAAFYRAGSQTADADAATTRSQRYVTAGYVVSGGPALDSAAEVRTAKSLKTASTHLPEIGRVLAGVGTHLADATTASTTEVNQLNGRITSIQNDWLRFFQTTGHHLPPEDRDLAAQGYVNQAVAAVKQSGGVVRQQITGYESTLASSLRSLADLGYLPPDAVDEGPGDVDLTPAAATRDANLTIAGISNGDRSAGIQQYDSSTQTVALLNRVMAANGRLSDAQFAYLSQYNQTLAPHLPALDQWLHDPATRDAVARTEGLSQSAPDQHQIDAALKQRGSVVADGVLNLSAAAEQPTDNGVGPNSYGPGGEQLGRHLPTAVSQYLSLNLGEQVPNDPTMAHDPTNPGSTLRATWDPTTNTWVVANASAAGGFSDLLANYSHQNVQGGDQFSKQLGEAGIRWKQELNTIHDNTQGYVEAEIERASGGTNAEAAASARFALRAGDTDLASIYLKQLGLPSDIPLSLTWNNDQFPGSDTFTSDALSVTAHNPTGSAQLLLDASDRRSVMGLNWQDSDGAAQTLVSGTMPSNDPQTPTNAATQAVMQDGAADYRNLNSIAAPGIKDALTTIAIDHIDSFGTPGDGHGATQPVTLPDGSVIHPVNLDATTAENYLKLVSSFGDDHYSLVGSAAMERGSQYIAAAQHAGLPQDSAGYATAWRMASELDGHVSGAGQAQLYDQFRSENSDTAAKLVAAHQAYRTQLGSYNDAMGATRWLTSAVSLGSNIAGVVPPLAEFKIPLDFVRTGIGMVQNTLSAPSNPLTEPPVFEDIYQAINSGSSLDQGSMAQAGALSGDQHWMAQRAHQLDTGAVSPISQLTPAQAVELEHSMNPTYSGTDSPLAAATSAYDSWAGSQSSTPSWTTGTGPADATYPWAPGGSWGNTDSAWQIRYGGNDRLTWDWDYQDAQVGPTANGDPYRHVLVGTEGSDNDPNTGTPSVDTGGKRSQWDHAR